MEPTRNHNTCSSPANRFTVALLLGWVALTAAGLYALLSYAGTAGPGEARSDAWPADTRLSRSADCHTLLMFAHPHCPCTAASVEELSRCLVHLGERVQVIMVFAQPSGRDMPLDTSSLFRSVRCIDGIETFADVAGTEALRFGALTSGHVMLFAPDGSLCFSGGLTPARGHAGENPGRIALEEWVLQGRSSIRRMPVYGCALHTPGPAAPHLVQQ